MRVFFIMLLLMTLPSCVFTPPWYRENNTIRQKLVLPGEIQGVQGIPCMKASFLADVFGGGAHFHDNGKLARCKLARDITIDGVTYRKGNHLNFDRDSNPVEKN